MTDKSKATTEEPSETRVERATIDNPDLPASFVRSVIEAMDEPREDAIPFAIRESRTVDYKLKSTMKKRLSRMQMFRRASLREYEAFVWRVYTRPKNVLANNLSLLFNLNKS